MKKTIWILCVLAVLVLAACSSDAPKEKISTITVDYAADYYPVGNSYLCICGWTREPLVEPAAS